MKIPQSAPQTMHTITTDNPNDAVREIKCHTEERHIRLTFLWPEDIEYVYIFKTNSPHDIESTEPSDGRLFTLQEYKKHGGFVEPRPSGTFKFYIYPAIREKGEDIAIVYPDAGRSGAAGNSIEITGQIPVQLNIAEKTSLFSRKKIYTVTLLAQQAVDGDVLCYVKKDGGYPVNAKDGIIYFFGDALEAGISRSWEIKTRKNEYIRVFVRDGGPYALI